MSQFTQREHLFIDDLMHMEELQTLVAVDLSSRCSDPEVANLLGDIARLCDQHFNTLLNHVDRAQGRQTYQAFN